MIETNIKKLRLNKKIKQNILAVKMGVSASTVSMWEKGLRIPNVQMLLQLATFFGCTIDDLLK